MLDVHASDYGRTWTALERRRAGLLQELSQVELDMATLRKAAEVISRYLGAPAEAEPVPDLLPIAEGLQEQPAATTLALPAPSSTNLPARSARLPTKRKPADQAIVAARAAMLGPPRDDARIPPKVDGKRRRLILADVPQGEAVREAYDRLAEISARAAPEKEPGGRHRLSSRGLVAGEPLVPSLLAVLRAAGRPLSTSDCVMAALQQRGLRLEGAELCAVVSRASARLGEEARKKRVIRIREPHERSVLWMIASP
ncbi:hypothetical protein [Roseomonas chloroacetimidivorans]|uniref:hypothetical protein n=1 Tax=Roseomonas chloroacetimidivorans TaxID=1766656 RepID=UPI003C70B0CB